MGKIELDHTGSGSGITLSSDGTDLLLDGTAVGGGGGFTSIVENYTNGTAPTVTGNDSVGIGDSTTASGSDSYAIGHFATAAGSQAIALGFLADVKSGATTGGAALGYSATVGAGASGVALGQSYVSGNNSFAATIENNTSSYGATGTRSIAIGRQSKASGSNSTAIGSFRATASGSQSIALGYFSTASSTYAVSIGSFVTADIIKAFALGYEAKSSIKGKFSYSASAFSAAGDAQTGIFVLRSDTTDATAEAMTTDNSAGSTDDQIILPNNSAYAFHGTIVARQQASGGTASAAWKVEGLIRREGSAGTTVLVNSATTVLDNTPSWGMALSADTTNGGLAITVTGAASTNIRWVATIHTSEVTYA